MEEEREAGRHRTASVRPGKAAAAPTPPPPAERSSPRGSGGGSGGGGPSGNPLPALCAGAAVLTRAPTVLGEGAGRQEAEQGGSHGIDSARAAQKLTGEVKGKGKLYSSEQDANFPSNSRCACVFGTTWI